MTKKKLTDIAIFVFMLQLIFLVNAYGNSNDSDLTPFAPISCDDQCWGRVHNCLDSDVSGNECLYEYSNCTEYCAAGGEGPLVRRTTEDGGECPSGSKRNTLGICVVNFTNIEARHPGCEPGPTDDCRIRIKMSLIPKGDGVFVICPNGLMPMPGQKACKMAVGVEDDQNEPGHPNCPPGWTIGPNERCVPPIRPDIAGEYDQLKSELKRSGGVTVEQLQNLHQIGEKAGLWFTTQNPNQSVEQTANSLGPDWKRD